MKEKNLIIICLIAVLCIGVLSATTLLPNQNNNNTSENDTINISLNDSQNNTTENTNTTKKTTTTAKSSENKDDKEDKKSEYGDYINDEWVSMSEEEYANRYPALYHEQSLSEGKYDKYHPEFYEVDRENGRI